MGTWYEIARYPNSFEKGMSHVKAHYSLSDDGTILVVNSGLKNGKPKDIAGFARFAGETPSGELEVSFFRPFYSPYRIIMLEDDYSAAIVCGKTDHYLWLLSRTPEISEKKMQDYISWMQQNGLPVEGLEYPAQSGNP